MRSKNLRRRFEKPKPPPQPTPFKRSPIKYLAPSEFSRIQEFGERFNKIVSEPSFKRSSDEEDLTKGIKPRRRRPPPWLEEKIYGQSSQQDQDDQDQDQDGPEFPENDSPPFRRRIR